MNAIHNPLFLTLVAELFICGMFFGHFNLSIIIVFRFVLSLRIGFATTLLFLSGGTYHSTITIKKDGEIIEEYHI